MEKTGDKMRHCTKKKIWHWAYEKPMYGEELLLWYEDGNMISFLYIELTYAELIKYTFCEKKGIPVMKWAYLEDIKKYVK